MPLPGRLRAMTENRWLCQLQSAAGPAGQREWDAGSLKKRAPPRSSRSGRQGTGGIVLEGESGGLSKAERAAAAMTSYQ